MRGVTIRFVENFLDLLFQLTRLMRGVTRYVRVYERFQKFQLTRLMRGVTTEKYGLDFSEINFNSHASCEA